MRRDARARLALSVLTEPADPRLAALLPAAGGAEALLAALRSGERVAGDELPAPWRQRATREDSLVERAVARADAAGLRWIAPGDPGWPAPLDDLDELAPVDGSSGTPLGLWVRGEGSLAALTHRSVAIVGARSMTAYGKQEAVQHAADLADAGFTIVSGAAFGIDAAAHRGALAVGRPTVAVLACGADEDYPRGNAALIGRIVERGGLVVSEQAPGAEPLRARFLSRNRIIAALAEATLVVEAARRSGSLNTLRWADRLGRTTMAVPGPVTSAQSTGVHQAIRDGRAVLVASPQQALVELGAELDHDPDAGSPDTVRDRLPASARSVLDVLGWDVSAGPDAVGDRAGLSRDESLKALQLLERRGLVARSESGWLLTGRADSA